MNNKIVLVSLVLVFISGIANAQDASSLGLSVGPQVFELDVFPGDSIPQKVTVGNLSSVALPMNVRMTDFTAEDNSGDMIFDEFSDDPSFTSRHWFKINPKNFIMEAGEKREVRFTIDVPKNAELGGRYAVMLFEPQPPAFYFQEGKPKTIPVVGVLFLLSVKAFSLEAAAVQKKIEVVEFSIPKEEKMASLENIFSKMTANVAEAADINIVEKTPKRFVLRVKNNDLYHIKPSGKVFIYNFLGKKVGESDVPKQTILPGKTRQFPVAVDAVNSEKIKWLPSSISNFLTRNFFGGRYSVVLQLQNNAGQGTAPETYWCGPSDDESCNLFFWLVPWKTYLALILLLVLLFLFRKRIALAASVLLKIKSQKSNLKTTNQNSKL